MFRNTATATEPASAETPADDLIPISQLALDLYEQSDWDFYLANRGVEVLVDDIGRKAISRVDAKMLLAEKYEAEARRLEAVARQEQRFIEADRLRRSRLWRGMPATALPDGMTAADAMLMADYDSRPPSVHEQLLEQEFGGSQTSMIYQPFPSEQDEAS